MREGGREGEGEGGKGRGEEGGRKGEGRGFRYFDLRVLDLVFDLGLSIFSYFDFWSVWFACQRSLICLCWPFFFFSAPRCSLLLFKNNPIPKPNVSPNPNP
jgi:hypothetical protein